MPRFTWWMRVLPVAAFWLLAYVYLTIPDVRPLALTNPSTTAFMALRQAEAQSAHRPLRRVQRWVSYNRISNNLKRAVLVAEDSAFWQHEGLDFEQIRESMEINLERMEFARGASTITQQLAKNLFLSPSKNPIRKVRELLITRRLETVLSKRRILELYLNVIEWGDGIWGAEAASRTYFGRSATALSDEDAALLAGSIINPRVLTPLHPTARLLRRQRLVLRRMGHVTPPPDAVPVSSSTPATPVRLDPSAFDLPSSPSARPRGGSDNATPGSSETPPAGVP